MFHKVSTDPEAGGGLLVEFKPDPIHHSENLDDHRTIDYCEDGSIRNVDFIDTITLGVKLDGLPESEREQIRKLVEALEISIIE